MTAVSLYRTDWQERWYIWLQKSQRINQTTHQHSTLVHMRKRSRESNRSPHDRDDIEYTFRRPGLGHGRDIHRSMITAVLHMKMAFYSVESVILRQCLSLRESISENHINFPDVPWEKCTILGLWRPFNSVHEGNKCWWSRPAIEVTFANIYGFMLEWFYWWSLR